MTIATVPRTRAPRPRWCVALICPPGPTVEGRLAEETRHALVKTRTRRAALARLREVEGWPEVTHAALVQGAWCDVRRITRRGFVR